jgi:hypothetical protein
MSQPELLKTVIRTLDQEYLPEWTLRLGIEREMERLRNEARTD